MGSGPASDPRGAGQASPLTAFLDTNVLIRHLTGDPPNQAALATATLSGPGPLLLADLILAECVYVLESFYEVEPKRVAELMRGALRRAGRGFTPIRKRVEETFAGLPGLGKA